MNNQIDLGLVDWGDSISIYKEQNKVLITNDELQKLISYPNTRRTDWMLIKNMNMNNKNIEELEKMI